MSNSKGMQRIKGYEHLDKVNSNGGSLWTFDFTNGNVKDSIEQINILPTSTTKGTDNERFYAEATLTSGKKIIVPANVVKAVAQSAETIDVVVRPQTGSEIQANMQSNMRKLEAAKIAKDDQSISQPERDDAAKDFARLSGLLQIRYNIGNALGVFDSTVEEIKLESVEAQPAAIDAKNEA